MKNLTRYFQDTWGTQRPIFKLFRTSNTGYLYDTGTNKVFGCHEPEFDFLRRVLSQGTGQAIETFIQDHGMDSFIQAGNTIKGVMEQEKILLSKGVTRFGDGDHFTKDLEEQINSSLGILNLEVTERCNLRCGYCVYNPQLDDTREHGTRDMDISVGHTAIDYLKRSSAKRKNVAIAFYGGEPLLCFPFIKSCVEYAQKELAPKKLVFSMTTNAVLLTREIAQYLADHHFSVLVSVDGPGEIHDRYRKDAGGKGTYSKVIEGLKLLVDRYGDRAKELIGISMVYAPPYNGKGVNRVAKLFEDLPWLPREMETRIAYPHYGSLPMEQYSQGELQEDKPLFDWSKANFIDTMGKKDEVSPIARGVIEKDLAQFMQRQIFNEPVDKYYLNGCCVPGVRKVFINVAGDILLCEKIYNNVPPMGTIYSGIDIKLVEEMFVRQYAEESLPLCSSCWASRLCNLCYIHHYTDGKFDSAKKKMQCRATRLLKERLLITHCEMIEKKPDSLDYLLEYELV